MLCGALWYTRSTCAQPAPMLTGVFCSPCSAYTPSLLNNHYMTFFSEASLLVHSFVFEGVRGVLNVYPGTFKFAEVLA